MAEKWPTLVAEWPRPLLSNYSLHVNFNFAGKEAWAWVQATTLWYGLCTPDDHKVAATPLANAASAADAAAAAVAATVSTVARVDGSKLQRRRRSG